MGKDEKELLEKFWEIYRLTTKGIRHKTLKKLVYTCYILRNVFFEDRWEELVKRKKLQLRPLFTNYLYEVDDIELDFIAQLLGVSKRTARDYINALKTLGTFGF